MSELLWTYFGRVSDFFGIVTMLVSIGAYLRLRRQANELRTLAERTPPIDEFEKRVKFSDGITSMSPVGLVVALIGEERAVIDRVQAYLAARNMKMPIESIAMNGLHGPGDLEAYINRIRTIRRQIDLAHHTEIHLFFAGPVQAGVLLGALLDNWIPVKLYQKSQLGSAVFYEYWAPIFDR